MSRIFVTGDTHGYVDLSKLNTKNFPEQKILTKDDYIIIAGDYGCIWDGDRKCPESVWENYELPPQLNKGKDTHILDWYENKNPTILFVAGNHENHKLLNAYPVEEWNGGFVHKIRSNIFHLMNGCVFTIDNKKFFVMGGASSTDRIYRKEDVSWWQEELPSREELNKALVVLDEYNWDVDYVITHDVGDNIRYRINPYMSQDILTNFLFSIDKDLNYKKWFFGHHHLDQEIDNQHICLYQNVIEII